MPADDAPAATGGSTLSRLLLDLRADFSMLSLTEVVTLLAVAENEGVTVNGLGQLCGYTVATASRTARGLTAEDQPGALAPYRGWLQLRRGHDENRRRYIFLTPAGVDVCRRIDAAMTDHDYRPVLAPNVKPALAAA